MPSSTAPTVADFLHALPDDRRSALTAVRGVIRANLPRGYEEAMNWGMIAYQVPLTTYSRTYNGRPLMYAALASQKHHMAVYLSSIYASERSRRAFECAYRQTGKRFDVGKSCVRFRTLDDLPLELIGDTIASIEVDALIALMTRAHRGRKASRRPASSRPGAGKKDRRPGR